MARFLVYTSPARGHLFPIDSCRHAREHEHAQLFPVLAVSYRLIVTKMRTGVVRSFRLEPKLNGGERCRK